MAARGVDVVGAIRAFNAGREPQRLAMKYAAMRGGPFAFLRATCHLFYDRLPADPIMAAAPSAWCCGDLHLENFGSYQGDDRRAYFDINDFDEAALAPLSWDLLRFATSVIVGAHALGLHGAQARALCIGFLDSYAATLAGGTAGAVEAHTSGGLVRSLLDDVGGRSGAAFLDRRTERHGAQRRIRIDGKHALAASNAERAHAEALLAAFARGQPAPAAFAPLDVARRIAGVGSLGLERYVILVRGHGGADGNELLDLKRAQQSSLAPHWRRRQPAWPTQARRIVAVQARLQAVPAAFLHALGAAEPTYVLRALLPSEDKVALERTGTSIAAFGAVVRTMAQVAASAHLRGAGHDGADPAAALIAFGGRLRWRSALLGIALGAAEQVRRDWATYCAAYDGGAFA
ncbi:MAG: DUF2252 family protein [Pseudomonadota bacterium]|nr:DUF2252 family protein [Pseudomonadota bacterium]